MMIDAARGYASPAWTNDYIGIPFRDLGRDRSGLDCWGLARLVLAEQFGITVPSFSENYTRTDERHLLSRVIDREASHWIEVGRGRAAIGKERLGDVVTFRHEGFESHIGIVINPKTWRMLHARIGSDSVDSCYNETRYKHQICRFLRHQSRA